MGYGLRLIYQSSLTTYFYSSTYAEQENANFIKRISKKWFTNIHINIKFPWLIVVMIDDRKKA